MIDTQELNDKEKVLKFLFNNREPEDEKLEQKHITIQSLIKKINIIQSSGFLENKRVLAIGDSDLSGTSIAIFGKPTEVVVVDIDKRLTNLLFEANLEFDLQVRFVYHDMRLKIIEVLENQYNLVIMDPPHSKAGIEVFISRAISCLEVGSENGIFVTIPTDGVLNKFFKEYLQNNDIEIIQEHKKIIEYINNENNEKGDFLQLKIKADCMPSNRDHWIMPFYAREEGYDIKIYRCACNNLIHTGKMEKFKNLGELQEIGCKCGHKGIFVYNSDVKII